MRITKTRTFTLKKVALALMIAAGTITSAYAVVTGSTGTIRGVIPVLKSASGADIHAVDFATNGTNPLMPVTGDTITMTYKYTDTDGDADNSTTTVHWYYVPANGTAPQVEITTGITNALAGDTTDSAGGSSAVVIPDEALGAIIKAVITEKSVTGDLNTGYTLTYDNVSKPGAITPGPDGGTDTGGGGETTVPDQPVGPGADLIPAIYATTDTGFTTNLLAAENANIKLKVGATYQFKLFGSDGTTDLTSTVNYKWKLTGSSATTHIAAPETLFNPDANFVVPANVAAQAIVASPDGVQGFGLAVDYNAKQ